MHEAVKHRVLCRSVKKRVKSKESGTCQNTEEEILTLQAKAFRLDET